MRDEIYIFIILVIIAIFYRYYYDIDSCTIKQKRKKKKKKKKKKHSINKINRINKAEKKCHDIKIKKKKDKYVYMDISIGNKSHGRVIIKLFDKIVPKTCKNFRYLINNGYKGTVFHRIIPGFMVQGGDTEHMDGQGTTSMYGGAFPDENFELKHSEPGLLSMANSGPDTNGSQFFIVTDQNGTHHLDNKHVVFGKVVDNMDLIYRVEKYGTEHGKPLKEVKIIDCGEIEI